MEQIIPGLIHSSDLECFAAALAKAQGEFKSPKKEKIAEVQMRAEKGGGKFTYKYADLADIMEAVTPALSTNGLALMQPIDAANCRLVTILVHESGQYMGSTYDLPKGLPAQQFGSALTYGRRYSVTALLGVVADEDDDAHGSKKHEDRNAKREARKPIVGLPKPNQTQGGTAGPSLPNTPKGFDRTETLEKIKKSYIPYMKLFPNEDPTAMMMERYGASKISELSDQEAFDFSNHMENKFKEGISS